LCTVCGTRKGGKWLLWIGVIVVQQCRTATLEANERYTFQVRESNQNQTYVSIIPLATRRLVDAVVDAPWDQHDERKLKKQESHPLRSLFIAFSINKSSGS
jgi:hypothetical protein